MPSPFPVTLTLSPPKPYSLSLSAREPNLGRRRPPITAPTLTLSPPKPSSPLPIYSWPQAPPPLSRRKMVQVALLCTQYLPGHRPKMSEVVRMLEGDGLAEKWEASQGLDPPPKFKVPESSSNSERCYSDLTDDSSLLVQAVELSGPRLELCQSYWVQADNQRNWNYVRASGFRNLGDSQRALSSSLLLDLCF